MNQKGVNKLWAVPLSGLLAVSLAACGSSPQSANPEPSSPPPAEPAAPAASGDQGFEAEWAKIVEAAKKEGEVVIYGQPFTDREQVMLQFEKVYPEIKVKYTGMRPNESGPKVIAEQNQGKYLADLYFEVQPDFPSKESVSMIRDYIVRPELQQDDAWVDGYEKGYELTANSNVYPFGLQPIPFIHINNDFIPKGEITSLDDLLDPKWKGKIIVGSFDRPAQGSSSVNGILMMKGEEFVRKLMEEQEVQYRIFDNRQIMENFATGKYPIAIGTTSTLVRDFVNSGAIKEVSKLEEETITAISPTNIGVLKNPPHPNATKVFVDWFLSKEGQTEWVNRTTGILSRRAGVESPDPELPSWSKIQATHSNHSVEGRKSHDWVIEYGKELMSKK